MCVIERFTWMLLAQCVKMLRFSSLNHMKTGSPLTSLASVKWLFPYFPNLFDCFFHFSLSSIPKGAGHLWSLVFASLSILLT